MVDPIVRIARRSQKSIFSKLMSAKWRFVGKSIALTDADGRELTYNEILRASFALVKVIELELEARHPATVLKVKSLLLSQHNEAACRVVAAVVAQRPTY